MLITHCWFSCWAVLALNQELSASHAALLKMGLVVHKKPGGNTPGELTPTGHVSPCSAHKLQGKLARGCCSGRGWSSAGWWWTVGFYLHHLFFLGFIFLFLLLSLSHFRLLFLSLLFHLLSCSFSIQEFLTFTFSILSPIQLEGSEKLALRWLIAGWSEIVIRLPKFLLNVCCNWKSASFIFMIF